MRKCNRCRQERSEPSFRTQHGSDRLRGTCRDCENEARRVRRSLHGPNPGYVTFDAEPEGGCMADFDIDDAWDERFKSDDLYFSKTTLVLGDIHYPYHHRPAVNWAIEMVRKYRPDRVVQVGDLSDQFAFSKFPKLVKMDPGTELKEAKLLATLLWAEVRAAVPNAECYQLMGNHDDRAIKRALERAPELTELVGQSLREFFTFDGVTTIHDSHEELILDGVVYQHGHRSKLGDHAQYNQRSTVCGHSHTGGVVFKRNLNGVFWELNAGFLGAVDSEAFAYHAQRKMHTCTLGIGLIDQDGPRFIPYKGR